MLKLTLDQFLQQASEVRSFCPLLSLRVAQPYEPVYFQAYAIVGGEWWGSKRLVIMVLVGDVLWVAIAPPVSSPFCISWRIQNEVAKALDQVLSEVGARYTSWCLVTPPPAFKPKSLRDVLELLTTLELLDTVYCSS